MTSDHLISLYAKHPIRMQFTSDLEVQRRELQLKQDAERHLSRWIRQNLSSAALQLPHLWYCHIQIPSSLPPGPLAQWLRSSSMPTRQRQEICNDDKYIFYSSDFIWASTCPFPSPQTLTTQSVWKTAALLNLIPYSRTRCNTQNYSRNGIVHVCTCVNT